MIDIFQELDDIDEKATIKNVEKVLRLYRKLERMAGEEVSTKMIATYSSESRRSSGGHSDAVGNGVSRKVAAQQEIEKINKAIKNLSENHQEIIFEKYMKRASQTDIMIYVSLCMSESTFYRELKKAKLEFAEVYEDRKLVVNK